MNMLPTTPTNTKPTHMHQTCVRRKEVSPSLLCSERKGLTCVFVQRLRDDGVEIDFDAASEHLVHFHTITVDVVEILFCDGEFAFAKGHGALVEARCSLDGVFAYSEAVGHVCKWHKYAAFFVIGKSSFPLVFPNWKLESLAATLWLQKCKWVYVRAALPLHTSESENRLVTGIGRM
jgi:hypothetical protein